jgi:hypothetical protein
MSPDTTDDMLADLGVGGAEADRLRALLGEVAGLAHEVPEPSDDVRALLAGAIPLHRRRPSLGGTSRSRRMVAAAVGALVLGGVSAAAAANRLPEPVQEVVADATGGVVPHPVKPVVPRKREVPPAKDDTSGHDSIRPKATTKHSSTGPGQIQKSTKPNRATPGPAHPANPGSHGRAHQKSNANSADKLKTEPRSGNAN